jgi:hypothetical protein
LISVDLRVRLHKRPAFRTDGRQVATRRSFILEQRGTRVAAAFFFLGAEGEDAAIAAVASLPSWSPVSCSAGYVLRRKSASSAGLGLAWSFPELPYDRHHNRQLGCFFDRRMAKGLTGVAVSERKSRVFCWHAFRLWVAATRVPAARGSSVWSESRNPVRSGRTHGGIKAREVHTEGERFVPFGEAFRVSASLRKAQAPSWTGLVPDRSS